MPQIGSLGAAGLATLLVLAGAIPLQGQEAPGPMSAEMADPQQEGPPHDPNEMAGVWDYNADDSINIQTGRPEQSPRSATQRGGLGAGAGATAGRAGGSVRGIPGAGPEGINRTPRLGGMSGIGPTPAMQREARDLARDLLEIPEALTIAVAPEAVTFTDDLGRERVYVTDGSKQEHQLGASRFTVRTRFDNGQLRKAIEGGFDFKMTETYFLSPDGKRLFVIVRVGEPEKGRTQAGFNRVYDRMDPEP
jgi:hypothetical protein